MLQMKLKCFSSAQGYYVIQTQPSSLKKSGKNFTWYSFSQDNSPEKLKLAQFPP